MHRSALVRVSVLALALVGVSSSPGCTAREPITDGSAVVEPAPPSAGLRALLIGPEWVCIEIDGAAIGDWSTDVLVRREESTREILLFRGR